jgi:hypothetical protein
MCADDLIVATQRQYAVNIVQCADQQDRDYALEVTLVVLDSLNSFGQVPKRCPDGRDHLRI